MSRDLHKEGFGWEECKRIPLCSNAESHLLGLDVCFCAMVSYVTTGDAGC